MSKDTEIKKEIKKLETRKEELLQKEEVIEYINIRLALRNAQNKLKLCHEEEMFKKYDKCHHYYILGDNKGKNVDEPICILCGLRRNASIRERDEAARIMNKYLVFRDFLLRKKKKDRGYKYYCDMKVADKIIKEIKNDNKGISNDELIKYFEIALDNMIDIPVTKAAVKGRAKRLGTSMKKIKAIHRQK